MEQWIIDSIYKNCNAVSFEELLRYVLDPASGITIEGLRQSNYRKIDQLVMKYGELAEDKIWNAGQLNENELRAYIKRCESHELSGRYLDEARLKLKDILSRNEDKEWEDVKTSHDVDMVDRFIQNCNEGIYSDRHLTEAISLKLDFEYETVLRRFSEIQNVEDLSKKETLLRDFLEDGAVKRPGQRYDELIRKAQRAFDGIGKEKLVDSDWMTAVRNGTLTGYLEFEKNHPDHFRYGAESRRKIEELKGKVLSDMRIHPVAYSREYVYELISSDVLTEADLVDSGILTGEMFRHILDYPSLVKEKQGVLQMTYDENPVSGSGNTDVYFFGVPGSGKTCVLGALLNLDGQLGFSYDPIGNGGAYAMQLGNYIRASCLPPSTDIGTIQVIDAEIKDMFDNREACHKVSLIEMSGEKTLEFASLKDAASLEDLGPGAAGLLENDNDKLLFFIIDPDNDGKQIRLGNSSIIVNQNNVLNCIASLLSKNKEILKKVIAIHIILTKSDLIGDNISKEVIRERFDRLGYTAVVRRLEDVCNEAHINGHRDNYVYLTPFSIGDFRAGEVYSFDDASARNILEVIKNNSTALRRASWYDKVKEFFTT